MNLKILGGELKGRNIKTPGTRTTRPITSLLRKSIFDTCQFYIEEARVLDLFAGSGAIGIEALSRGAKLAYFIDNEYTAVQCIKENLLTHNLKNRSHLLDQDAFLFLEEYDKEPFDILFIDPPYPIGLAGYQKLIDLLLKSKALSQNSKIFLEGPTTLARSLTPILEASFTIRRQKQSGTTTLFQLLLK